MWIKLRTRARPLWEFFAVPGKEARVYSFPSRIVRGMLLPRCPPQHGRGAARRGAAFCERRRDRPRRRTVCAWRCWSWERLRRQVASIHAAFGIRGVLDRSSGLTGSEAYSSLLPFIERTDARLAIRRAKASIPNAYAMSALGRGLIKGAAKDLLRGRSSSRQSCRSGSRSITLFLILWRIARPGCSASIEILAEAGEVRGIALRRDPCALSYFGD